MEARMVRASEEERFEEAALLRDQLSALSEVAARQKVVSDDGAHRDIIAFDREGRDAVVVALQIRDGLLVDLEIEPHIYFILNSTDKAARMVEDIGLPNVFPNLDIGHFTINREAPHRIEKIKDKIIHIHLSETQGYEHTNSIIGTGTVDFASYVRKAVELGVEENCKRVNQPCIAGIEMGEPHYPVDNPDRWMTESLKYLAKHLPELKP